MTRRSPFIYKEGRKISGDYYLIKVHELDAGGARLLYRAYSPRSAQESSVVLTREEIRRLLQDEVHLLEDPAAAGTLHARVIDKLAFEQRLAPPLPAAGTTSNGPPAAVRTSETLAALRELAGEAAASAAAPAAVGAASPLPPVAGAGWVSTAAYRAGRKIGGKYFVITGRVTRHDRRVEEGAAPGGWSFDVQAYNPGSSLHFDASLMPQEIANLLASDDGEPLRASLPPGCGPVPPPAPGFVAGPPEQEALAVARDLGRPAAARAVHVLLNYALGRVAEAMAASVDDALSEAAEAERESGNKAYLAKDFGEALVHYTRAVTHMPSNLTYRLNLAAALLETGAHDEAAHECKVVVAAARRQQAPGSGKGTGTAVEPAVAKAYARLGAVYMRQKRPARAVSAYTLSLKSQRHDAVEGKLRDALAASAAEAPASQRQAPDIEDMLSNHLLLRRGDTFKFECTGCGECCRTADNIFISPADLWRMTRAPGMVEQGVVSTRGLYSKFEGAVKFVMKDGVPVGHLRPVKNASGRCSFSYPLYRRAGTGRVGEGKAGDGDGKAGGDNGGGKGDDAPDAADEGDTKTKETRAPGPVVPLSEVLRRRLGDADRPVLPSEYNLTEEEERMAADTLHGWDEASGEAATASPVAAGGAPAEVPSEAGTATVGSAGTGAGVVDDEGEVEAVYNSFGRHALGCMFGVANMPTMCASYPVARELAWADFWHEYPRLRASAPRGSGDSEVEDGGATPVSTAASGGGGGGGGGDGGGCGGGSSDAAERVLVVRTEGCEGFFQDGVLRTDVWGGSATVAREQTMGEFMARGRLDERFEDDDWFKRLIGETIRSDVPAELLSRRRVLSQEFGQMLTRLWYDFDSTPLLRSRHPTTWRRARQLLTTATSTLVAEVRAWLQSLPAPGAPVGDPAAEGEAAEETAELRALAVRAEVY